MASPAADFTALPPHPKWRERLVALKNIPPVMRFVWEAAPHVVVASISLRVTAALDARRHARYH